MPVLASAQNSNLSLGVQLQTKYVWRGMEMQTVEKRVSHHDFEVWWRE